MKIGDIGCQEAIHIPHSCTLQEAAVQMRDKHVGSLIVTEAGEAGTRALGMVTDRDIVVTATADGADPARTLVSQIASQGLVTIQRGADTADAVQMMLAHGIRRLGLLDGETVTGVVSMDDLLGAMANEWRMLATVVRNEQERERTGHVQGALRV
ncbi:CBS domain-containing protein [Cupriavidus pauculus]|uniref:CBS domain-containing protein n=1 Tax=Cupriavidus pauculus TaxID=82633 RepID=UPI0007858B30|nr:CBS domain-containing protein [Cupriavidus pauculus]